MLRLSPVELVDPGTHDLLLATFVSVCFLSLLQGIHSLLKKQEGPPAKIEYEAHQLQAKDPMLPSQLAVLGFGGLEALLLANQQILELILPERGQLTDVLDSNVPGQ